MMFNPFGFGHGEDDDEHQDIDLYEILAVDSSASKQQIRDKYDELMKKHAEDEEKLQEIKEAYEILSDPDRRAEYDDEMHQKEQIMKMFGGGGSKGEKKGGKKQLPKVKPIKRPLEVDLETVYNGGSVDLDITRAKICEDCKGEGGKGVKKCKDCKGKGVVIKMAQVGPGMYSQVQQYCDTCKGQGEVFEQQNKCKTCKGEKVIEQNVTVKAVVPKGIPNQEAIVIEGEGNSLPECQTGDVVAIVSIKPHPVFTRAGADLFMKKHITLFEALTGTSFTLHFLDGKDYNIQSNPGEVLGDKQKRIIKDLGMPYYKDKNEQHIRGSLVIQFHVDMPATGSIKDLEGFAKILGGKPTPRPADHNYELLEHFDAEELNTNEEGGRRPDDEEEEEGEGQGIRCATQ